MIEKMKNRINNENHWYGNMKTGVFGGYIEGVSPVPEREDISLRITQDDITPGEAKELLGTLDVVYSHAKYELEEIAGPAMFSERLEFRLTTCELNTLTTAAEEAGKTRSELLRDMIHGVGE